MGKYWVNQAPLRIIRGATPLRIIKPPPLPLPTPWSLHIMFLNQSIFHFAIIKNKKVE